MDRKAYADHVAAMVLVKLIHANGMSVGEVNGAIEEANSIAEALATERFGTKDTRAVMTCFRHGNVCPGCLDDPAPQAPETGELHYPLKPPPCWGGHYALASAKDCAKCADYRSWLESQDP